MSEKMLDTAVPKEQTCAEAIADPHAFDAVLEALLGENRRQRQYAAGVVLSIAMVHPELLVHCIDQLVETLGRPEAQTRWQVLDVLSILMASDPASCWKGLDDAVVSLYDEESPFAHLSAVRFLCRYGQGDPARSKEVWPFLDEAMQCYHGDTEFQDMLTCIIEFSTGNLDPEVRKALADRVRFDAENGTGPLRRRTKQILDNCTA